MVGVLDSIRRGFGGLARFSGRDPRRRFWPYAVLVVGLVFAALGAVMSWIMAGVFERMQKFAVEHPDQARVTSGPGSYSIQIQGDHPELIPDLTPFLAVLGIGMAASVALLAAAIVRRLHDRGRAGYWGLAPLPFIFIAFGLLPRLFDSISAEGQPMGLFLALFCNNMLYLASVALLVVLLAKESDPGPNRFGAPEA